MVGRIWRRALGAVLLSLAMLPVAVVAQPAARGGAGAPRERLAQLVRERLGLTDEQARRLRDASARFGRERQALVFEERQTRRALRDLLQGSTPAERAAVDEQAVAAALDRLLALQQRRLALLQEEQRELARFLTPSQRAEYLGLQERALRAAQRVRLERERGAPGRLRPGPGLGGPP